MNPAEILPPETSVSDRLLTTTFLTALFHLVVVLGITFAPPKPPAPGRVPSLDVMLVSEEVPESASNNQAHYLAQRTQQGAGNMDRPDSSRNPGPGGGPEESSGETDGATYQEAQTGRSGGISAVLAADSRRGELVYIADDSSGEMPTRPRETSAGAPTPLPSAGTDSELRLKGSHSRELLVTASTRASSVAVYLDAWRRKVERVGTLHFPNEARRRRMSGSPVLEITLRADGHLGEVWIRRSSGHAELDAAAVGVLKLASPFDPFPARIAAGHDSLRFAYEWQFIRGASTGSVVSSVGGAD